MGLINKAAQILIGTIHLVELKEFRKHTVICMCNLSKREKILIVSTYQF